MTREEKLERLCRLTLLFHSGSPWTWEKQQEWSNALSDILGPADARGPEICRTNPESVEDRTYYQGTNEATTRNLCSAIRAVLNGKR